MEKDGGPEEVAFEWVENVLVPGDGARDAPEGIDVRAVVQCETRKAGDYP